MTIGRFERALEPPETACRDLVYEFCDCTDGIDGRTPNDIAELFAETAVLEFGDTHPVLAGKRLEGRPAIAAYFEDRASAILTPRFRHLVTNMRFSLTDPAHALGRSMLTTFSLQDPEPLMVDCLQEMRDEFVLDDDVHWRIASRVYVDLSRRDPAPRR